MEILLTFILIFGFLSFNSDLEGKPETPPHDESDSGIHVSATHPKAHIEDVRVCREEDRRIIVRDLSRGATRPEAADAP